MAKKQPAGDAEILAFLERLPGTGYPNDRDRYQDFRQLFTGSEQGKRVLYEILSWGKLFRPSVASNPIDPYALAISEGSRNLALKLLHVVNQEPPEPPKQTQRKKPGDK